ncbi:MAG: glycosyltransferase [Myxococcota bacterium]
MDGCPALSVVIPARNESSRLPQCLNRLASYQRLHSDPLEVIVVDDHSSDETRAIACLATRRLQVRVIAVPASRRGPGAAMRTGLIEARAPEILLCDADGPVPFEEIQTLRQALAGGADLAAGSRLVGDLARPPRPLIRRVLARGFRTLVGVLSPTPVRDTQCGFKLMTRELAQKVGPTLQIDGFVFHVELLVRASRLGFRVVEVGVPWRDVEGSSIHPIRDSLRMAFSLLKLRRELDERRKSADDASQPASPTSIASVRSRRSL